MTMGWTPPPSRRHRCAKVEVSDDHLTRMGASTMNVTAVGSNQVGDVLRKRYRNGAGERVAMCNYRLTRKRRCNGIFDRSFLILCTSLPLVNCANNPKGRISAWHVSFNRGDFLRLHFLV